MEGGPDGKPSGHGFCTGDGRNGPIPRKHHCQPSATILAFQFAGLENLVLAAADLRPHDLTGTSDQKRYSHPNACVTSAPMSPRIDRFRVLSLTARIFELGSPIDPS